MSSSASPTQFCFDGQQQLPGTGPPIPSILSVFLIMGLGLAFPYLVLSFVDIR